MKIQEKYMRRCLALAENGLGRTYPNPMVGSVIVHRDRIIGEGWHQKAGAPHAEVNAIHSVKDRALLPESSIYVSLEPCSHYGKTPPCSDLIIASGIKRVVIGMVDPFPEVAGRGIKKLMDAGCEVLVGVLEEECRELNKRFFTYIQKKRPYIILKWAQTQNALLAPDEGREERNPVWISNRYSKQLVHKWRTEEAAILVGTQTAVADNPMLNARLWKGTDPVRIVLDPRLRIPEASHLFDGSIKTLRIADVAALKKGGGPAAEPDAEDKAVSNEKKTSPKESFTAVNPAGAPENVVTERIDYSKEVAAQICSVLYRHSLQSVIIEGGAQTLQTFIDSGLWDEARVITGSASFKNGLAAPRIHGRKISEKKIHTDLLNIYRND